MRISDWSSDVCSSDLKPAAGADRTDAGRAFGPGSHDRQSGTARPVGGTSGRSGGDEIQWDADPFEQRSEEHTSELQSLMRISYAVFCLKKKKNKQTTTQNTKLHDKASIDSYILYMIYNLE